MRTFQGFRFFFVPFSPDRLDSLICSVARLPNRAYLRFAAHDGEVNAAKWAPHGLVMATGGGDRRIK